MLNHPSVRLCGVLVGAWLIAGPAAATARYGASSGAEGQQFFAVFDSEVDFGRDAQYCDAYGICFETGARAGPGGLALYQQIAYVAPGASAFGMVGTTVTALGTMALQADHAGGPAFVDGMMSLRVPGGNGAQLDRPSFEAQVYAGLRLTMVIGDRRYEFAEHDQVNSTWSPSYSDRMWRQGADTVSAWVSLPVGSFSFTLIMAADGVGQAYGSVGFLGRTGYQLGFFADRPLVDLPAGYHLSSADFAIQDNQWCPGGCAPIPEPGTWALWMAGLAALGVLRRRGRA